MNIFDSITKEKFIEEFNKEGNGCLSLLQGWKKIKLTKIENLHVTNHYQ